MSPLQAIFRSFALTNVPSYGSKGYEIILFTLLHMFPITAINLPAVRPLSYDMFVSRVILPEVCVRLIQQDLGLSYAAAVNTLQESDTFGQLQYHPGLELDEDVWKLTRAATALMDRHQDLLSTYSNANTELDFATWIEAQQDAGKTAAVKLEEADTVIPHAANANTIDDDVTFEQISENGRTIFVVVD